MTEKALKQLFFARDEYYKFLTEARRFALMFCLTDKEKYKRRAIGCYQEYKKLTCKIKRVENHLKKFPPKKT